MLETYFIHLVPWIFIKTMHSIKIKFQKNYQREALVFQLMPVLISRESRKFLRLFYDIHLVMIPGLRIFYNKRILLREIII